MSPGFGIPEKLKTKCIPRSGEKVNQQLSPLSIVGRTPDILINANQQDGKIRIALRITDYVTGRIDKIHLHIQSIILRPKFVEYTC